ncbi:uncharacterized protein LOC5513564 isoform X1 [Nematostella vectensis]|uniref:uncharacterized protein LOC5513564 isoform X1 n=1 Tax=Nematostella vectensis TaxID=45351 RepID=UPI00207756EB|nr:uncharacterized protein LOC5513564 isoform X1 [Nematostella vectensis]
MKVKICISAFLAFCTCYAPAVGILAIVILRKNLNQRATVSMMLLELDLARMARYNVLKLTPCAFEPSLLDIKYSSLLFQESNNSCALGAYNRFSLLRLRGSGGLDPNPRISKRGRHERDSNSFLGATCCVKNVKKKCLENMLNRKDIQACRSAFWNKTEEEQREFIISFLVISHHKDDSGRNIYNYQISRKTVCQKAWLFAYGISNGRFHNLRLAYEEGSATHIGERSGPRAKKSKKYMSAQLWFEEFVRSMADRLPNEDKLHLPSCFTKRRVYNTYREAMVKKNKQAMSVTRFQQMWKKEYKRVMIPKVNRYTKCGVCTLIKENILNIKTRRLNWLEKRRLHLVQQSAERKKYYKHRHKAEENPLKYLSVITDGMDQAKTNVPYFHTKSKMEGENAEFLKTHVLGVISHGHNRTWCILDLLRYPADANATACGLIHVLQSIVSQKGSLPPTLYWQKDNCSRDCKNVYILGFCAFLVAIGAFKKVKLSYLMVGHTHEDVDQMFSRISGGLKRKNAETIDALRRMFSRISGGLKRKNAETIDALRRVIAESYTPRPCTSLMNAIFDIKEWLRPYILGFKNHSHPHYLRFKKNGRGEVEMVLPLLGNRPAVVSS